MPAHLNVVLGPVGEGLTSPRRRGFDLLAAVGPILAMLAALALVTATGFSQRSAVPEAVEPWIYGYFIGRYPLFVFALVYGVAHLVAVASGPGPASAPRRLVFALAGAAGLALAGLYPTVGGLILRAGFATGGMAFLTHQPLWMAYGLGSGVAAALFGAVLGLFAVAANRVLRPTLRQIGFGVLAFLALWVGAALIGLAGHLGLGPWPRRALQPDEAGLAALILVAAALPHTALSLVRRRRPAS
jgi:hypothetical protein